MNYPMYNNSQMYLQDLQNMRDRIDAQMRQFQQPAMQQTPAINQTFQLSNPPNADNDFDGKYATNLDEVKNTLALKNTFFVNKEMNTLWFKDVSGNIKTYTLSEVIELDAKDQEILELKKEIENMKGMIANNSANADVKKGSCISENKKEKKDMSN